MKIMVVGTGYVGLVTGVCFSEMGNEVYCVDIDAKKVELLKSGVSTIYEPGLDTMLQENLQSGRLRFTTSLAEAVVKSEVCFIAVGTPMGEDGSADLQYVQNAAKEIGESMQKHLYVIDKSTVPVGTADMVRETIQGELDKRNSKLTFDVISNPEFLKEGTAVNDCLYPNRVVIGAEDDKTVAVMKELYSPFIRNTETFILMDIRSAEMTKYAANAMLATKISFINEIANICERVGANVNSVRTGIGSDPRIGYQFIFPGCGYGGSCFPKDVQALVKTSMDFGYTPSVLSAVEDVNKRQKHVLSEKVIRKFGNDLKGKTFALWGLAFKPDTDDMRAATALTVIEDLTALGAKIKAYDPKAIKVAKEYYLKDNSDVTYYDSKYDALNDANAMILVTEWKEFRSPDFSEIKQRMSESVIFDGRNQYNASKLKNLGFEYYQIGVAER